MRFHGNAVDLVGFTTAIVASSSIVLGYVIEIFGMEWSLAARSIVAFGVGFFTALFIHVALARIQSPLRTLSAMRTTMKEDPLGAALTTFLSLVAIFLGLLAASGPILNCVPAPVGGCLFLGGVLFSGFTLPSYLGKT